MDEPVKNGLEKDYIKKKVLTMDYIKEEWLVFEIAGAELATINTKKVFDEAVVRGVMRLVRNLFIAGFILVLLPVALGLTIPNLPHFSILTTFMALVLFAIGTFYYIMLIANRKIHENIVMDKAKGTMVVQKRFGNREGMSKETVNIVDVTQVECRTEAARTNYAVIDICARDKNDQYASLVWLYVEKTVEPPKPVAKPKKKKSKKIDAVPIPSDDVHDVLPPLEHIMVHLNAWLHGDEAGPAVYQAPLKARKGLAIGYFKEKVLSLHYTKGSWYVLEIAGADLATFKRDTVLDEPVVHALMLMVRYLFLVGAILVSLGAVLGSSNGIGLGIIDGSGFTFFGILVCGIATLYFLPFFFGRNTHNKITADRATGTIYYKEWFGNRENKVKPLSKYNLEDITGLECRTREVRGEGMNYDVVGICVRDKNDKLTEMDSSSSWEMQSLEGLLSHFNAWLHGDEVRPAVYRI